MGPAPARTGKSERFFARGRSALTASAALALLTGAGCVSRGNVDALEAQLRQTEDHLRKSQRQLVKTESDLQLARKETDLVRQQIAKSGASQDAVLPEQTQSLARVAGLSINKLMSGGKDGDGDKRDEAIQVIVSPLDADGDLVKIAGQMEIEAYDLSKTGEDKRIGRWEFDSSEARKHWHSGFLSSGFQFHLPWQEMPAGKDILVHARLTTSDGRQFDTNQTLVVQAGTPVTTPGRVATPPALERIAPPRQVSQVVEQMSAQEREPLPMMGRPLKRTADVGPIATAMDQITIEDTTVEVGKATLDFVDDTAEVTVRPWSSKPFRPIAAAPEVLAAPQGPGESRFAGRSQLEDMDAAPAVVPPPRDPEEDMPRALPPKRSLPKPAAAEPAATETAAPFAGRSAAPSAAESRAPGGLPPRQPDDSAPRVLPSKRDQSKPAAAAAPAPASPAGSDAPPFPRGLSTTSDAWTDESIPRLR